MLWLHHHRLAVVIHMAVHFIWRFGSKIGKLCSKLRGIASVPLQNSSSAFFDGRLLFFTSTRLTIVADGRACIVHCVWWPHHHHSPISMKCNFPLPGLCGSDDERTNERCLAMISCEWRFDSKHASGMLRNYAVSIWPVVTIGGWGQSDREIV